MKQNKGITVVALVVTIVIILLIAGVSISAISGGDGLFAKTNHITTLYNNKVESQSHEMNSIIQDIYVPSKPGAPGLEDDVNVWFTLTPDTWAKSVQVAITTTEKDYTLQYSLNGTSWQDYEEPFTLNQLATVYAKLVDSNGSDGKGQVEKQITNIDTINPLDFTIENIERTETTIAITGITTDGVATTTSGSSGIAGYKFKIDNNDWTDIRAVNDGQAGAYEFRNLLAGSTHTVQMMAVDEAGNTATTPAVEVTTHTPIPELIAGDNITIAKDPTTWTNTTAQGDGPVMVTINQTATQEFQLQYRLTGTTEWATYTQASGSTPAQQIPVTVNGTVIEARLIDLVNNLVNGEPTRIGRSVAFVVENIDKLCPTNTNYR